MLIENSGVILFDDYLFNIDTKVEEEKALYRFVRRGIEVDCNEEDIYLSEDIASAKNVYLVTTKKYLKGCDTSYPFCIDHMVANRDDLIKGDKNFYLIILDLVENKCIALDIQKASISKDAISPNRGYDNFIRIESSKISKETSIILKDDIKKNNKTKLEVLLLLK